MAKTWQNIIDDARDLLQDQREPHRYASDRLLARLNHALMEVGRLRPEAYFDRFHDGDIIIPQVVLSDPLPVTSPDIFDPDEAAQVAITDTFELSSQFYTPIVYFVAGSAELVDDEFVNDGRAMMLLNQFRANLLQL